MSEYLTGLEAMSGLAEFLRARIAEDEAVARAASRLMPWAPMCDWVAERTTREVGMFILDHHPARVLVECRAKRVRLEVVDDMEAADGVGWITAADNLRKIEALPYADHPDYRPEWKP